jgi:hypothetical protein
MSVQNSIKPLSMALSPPLADSGTAKMENAVEGILGFEKI